MRVSLLGAKSPTLASDKQRVRATLDAHPPQCHLEIEGHHWHHQITGISPVNGSKRRRRRTPEWGQLRPAAPLLLWTDERSSSPILGWTLQKVAGPSSGAVTLALAATRRLHRRLSARESMPASRFLAERSLLPLPNGSGRPPLIQAGTRCGRAAVVSANADATPALSRRCERQAAPGPGARTSSRATVSLAWSEMPARPSEQEPRSHPGIVLLRRPCARGSSRESLGYADGDFAGSPSGAGSCRARDGASLPPSWLPSARGCCTGAPPRRRRTRRGPETNWSRPGQPVDFTDKTAP
jgi:hypothetical protein